MLDPTLLQSHLSLCVPLEIDHLKRHGGVTDWHISEAQRRARELRVMPEGHESLMFRLPPTREAIVVLVECLAVMAFLPGGVKFAGMHFDACRHGWMKEVSA